MHSWPSVCFSFMKCLSIPKCFVLSSCTGLWAMLIATLLSQYKERFIFQYSQLHHDLFSHKSSQTPSTVALYSAFAVDLATTVCFLYYQVTKFPPYECAITWCWSSVIDGSSLISNWKALVFICHYLRKIILSQV